MRQRILWTWLAPVMCFVALGILLPALAAEAQPPLYSPARAAELCDAGLSNGGFEEDTAWVLPTTAYPAAYSSERAHSGDRSLRAGILITTENRYSYSAAN